MEACMHAAQNELLPLRVVVQVLFFEQARAAAAGGKVTDLPSNIKALLSAHGIDSAKHNAPLRTNTSLHAEDQWSVSGFKSPKSSTPTLRMKLAEDDNEIEENEGIGRSSTKFKGFCALPAQPRRILSKLWSNNKNSPEKK